MTDSETETDVENSENSNYDEPRVEMNKYPDNEYEQPNCVEKSGKKKKKKRKQIERDYSSEESSSENDGSDCEQREIKSRGKKSTRTSWTSACLKIVFYMFLMGSFLGGAFTIYTVQYKPNSRLGKLFIKSGKFAKELAHILIEDESLENNLPHELQVKNTIDIKLTEQVESVSDQHDTSRATRNVGIMDHVLELFTSYGLIEQVDGRHAAITVDDSVLFDDIDEDDEAEPEIQILVRQEPTRHVTSSGVSSGAQDEGGHRMYLSNILGLILIVGSVIIRLRPTIRSLNKKRNKFLRKEKNAKLVSNISKCFSIAVVLLLGYWALHLANPTALASLGEVRLRLSDIIAALIVFMSGVLYTAKHAIHSKPPLGTSYFSRNG